MKQRHVLLLAVSATFGLLVWTGAGGVSAAPNLDPFQPRADPAASARLTFAHPYRLVSQTAPTSGRAAPPPTPTPPQALACARDDECPVNTICQNAICQGFERPVKVLLFRKEGPHTAFIPFFWSRRGNPGYRVFAPFYWHFWSPEGQTRAVAPFYWRSEDHLKRRVLTVVLLYSHSRQPDAQSWAVWPLFYGSTKFGWAAPLFASFKLEDPDSGRSLGLYGLLYFWKRSPERAFDLGFPLFVSSRSAEKAFTFALPLNFYWRNEEDRNLLALPVLYRGWSPEGGTLVSPFGYASRSGASRRGSLLWVYWYGRKSQVRHDVLFPLVWSFRSPQSNTTIVPPVLHLRRGAWSLNALLPVAFWSKDEAAQTTWKLVLPAFFSRTRLGGQDSLWFTPIGGYRRNDELGTRALTFLVPPLIWRRTPQYEFGSYGLLYWRYRNMEAASDTRLLGPYYSRTDPEGTTRTLFPLFWHFRDSVSDATAHSLFPLYFRRRSPDETTTAVGVFPLWFYHRRFTDEDYSVGLFPLVSFGRREGRRHATIFPLFFHSRDAQRSSTVAIPFYYQFADHKGASAGIPPLLYFQRREGQDHYRVQFPLFWRFVNGSEGAATTVLPPFFLRTRRDGWSAGLAPLVFVGGGERRHFVLFPAFWHWRDDRADKTTTLALNYLHRRHGGEVTDALFPIFHYRRGAKPGGAEAASFTLFPFVHYRRNPAETIFLSPLAAWSRTPARKAGVVLPYFWYETSQIAARGVPPLYFDLTRLQTGERTRFIGPYFQLDGPGRQSRLLFPFFARYQNEKETGTYLFPTYFRQRSTDGYALDTVFPLFWRSTWPGHTTTVVGPYFRQTGPDRGTLGLAPLFVYARNPQRQFLATPLFVQHANHETQTRRFFSPLYYHSSRPDGYTSILFPLWWAGRTDHSSHRIFFPLYWHFGDARRQKAFSMLGPFLWSQSGTHRTRGIMPIAWYSRDQASGFGSNALVPLFYERHAPGRRLLITALFGFQNEPGRQWWYAGPLFSRENWKSSFGMLFPLWFSHHEKITDTRTRVIPPLLYFGRSSPEQSTAGWLLLFWRHRGITSSTTLGLPLFYDIHAYDERRLTMLLPVFFRYRSHPTDTTYTMAPLFYRRSSSVDATTVAFPFVWDFRGADRRTTIVFPLYAGLRRPTWNARFIFPNIYYRTGLGPEAGTSRLFIFPLWESAVKRPGDYMWEALLGLVGWERVGRNRFLKLFFYPFQLEAAPAARTAWYGKPALAARPRRATGLRTDVW